MRAHSSGRGKTSRVVFLVVGGLAALAMLAFACAAFARKASHEGWPRVNGRLLMNHHDQSRPLIGHPTRHNELLGGHGSDTITAGQVGDIIWGDYKPCCQPSHQVDRIYGGAGKDFIYASHGRNYVYTGGGPDVVHAHFGARGSEIHCDSPGVLVYMSHKRRSHYKLYGCKRISYSTERMRRG